MRDGGDITFNEYNNAKVRKLQSEDGEDIVFDGYEPGRKVAFKKLENAIKIARKIPKIGTKDTESWHIWIDSCCINRDSSSELSEALNSMYQYYSKAKECLVYLDDFSDRPNNKGHLGNPPDFTRIEWFKRGWTLQELIAPCTVTFYNSHWESFGHRSDSAIHKAIHNVTNIPTDLLTGKTEHWDYTVAHRMSWAANRKTTREEDMSYSLFGLFDVNLVPMYGEGARNAFLRLQEAIMSQTTDLSLFAWKANNPNAEYRGILARTPDEFSDAAGITRTKFFGDNPEFSMTNKGLKIKPFLVKQSNGKFFLPLNCAKPTGAKKTIGVILKRISEEEVLHRCDPGSLEPFEMEVFSSDHSFWPKQSEAPIYIVKDELHQKEDTDEKGQSRKKRSRRTRQAAANRVGNISSSES